jgi:hypothetical protein
LDVASVAPGGAAAASFVLLGADAYLAARPATAVQLAHACSEAGYAAAIPATWGDELVATECARQLAGRSLPPAIFCACRRVRDRLLAPGADLLPFLVSMVAPPVAAARYLRAIGGDAVLTITYVGECPSASDPVIDRQITPDEFLAGLADRGIVAARKPLVFDSVFAPDRRRCFSLPGGVPVEELLRGVGALLQAASIPEPLVPRSLVEIATQEYAADVAQHLIQYEPVLIDLGPRLGCACSGAVAGVAPTRARTSVIGGEPPRSPTPILERDVHVELVPAGESQEGDAGDAAHSGVLPAAAYASAVSALFAPTGDESEVAEDGEGDFADDLAIGDERPRGIA